MDMTVYLPDTLKAQIDSYAKSKGISKNEAIRRAIEQLLWQEQTASWGTWINNLASDSALDNFESYRSELKEPQEDVF